ncbi:MAG: energy-coupling factor transporter ATPase [Eubacteriales bacterium]
MEFIKIEGLKYRYPETTDLALDDISFTVKKGEFLGIIGENGAGKSTLCQAILGLVPQFYKGAYGGSVVVDGLNASEIPVYEMCQKVGLVFQNPFNQLSGAKDNVFEEVAFGLQNLGVEPEEIKRKVESVLHKLEIYEYKDKNPFELSGGQMQRVAIASILAMEPPVIILDEPTSQLDPAGSEEVFHIVELLKQTGITIIMVEHKIHKLTRYCDKIMVLQQGKLVAIDTPKQIFARDDLEELGIQPLTAQGKVVYSDLEKAKIKNYYKVENISFSYDENTQVLKNCSFEIDGRTTAIVGQNGAGKTTAVRLLKGLLKPQKGTIHYKNENIATKTVAMLAGEVGYVFQNPDDQLFKYTVLEEVMFGALNLGMKEEAAKEKAMIALAKVKLQDKMMENPYDLELAERKMVAVASVLAMDPEVIILDEPTIAQDYKGKCLLKEIIRDLRENGKAVIAILHDMEFVSEVFERVIVMAHGEILMDATPELVFQEIEILHEARLEAPVC